MEQLNNEKKENIIRWLCSKNGTSLPIRELLNKYIFTQTNLIIQQNQQYAMYYLDIETFNDKEKKDKHIKELFEVISFLKFLNTKGYICIYQNSYIKNDEIYSLGEFIKNPRQHHRKLILNDDGAYSVLPDCIQNADDEIIYKGIKFNSEEYSLIKAHTIGNIFISKTISNIFDCSSLRTDNEIKNAKQQNKEEKEKRSESTITKESNEITFHEKVEKENTLNDINLKNKVKEKNENSKNTLKNQEEYIFDYYKLLKNMLLLLTFIVTFSMLLFFYYNIKELKKSDIKNTNTQMEIKKHIDKLEKTLNENNIKKYLSVDTNRWRGENTLIQLPRYIDFVLIQATVGIVKAEESFTTTWENLDKASILKGAYHTFIYGEDPILQANNFYMSIHNIKKEDISPLVTLNRASLISNNTFNNKKFQKELLLFLLKIEKLTNRKPIIYAKKGFSDRYLKVIKLLGYKILFKTYNKDKTSSSKNFSIQQNTYYYDSKSKKEAFDIFYGEVSKLKEN